MNIVTEKTWLPERIAVVGAARSGIAVAAYLHGLGKKVFISDAMPSDKLSSLLFNAGFEDIDFEGGGNTERVLESELIICSPGVPSDIPILKAARERNIPVWAEIELAFRQSSAFWIALTGSTGKSTTVSLIGAAIDASGVKGVVAGNIGLPLISVAPTMPESGIITAEISSFQLENIELFRPKVACIINLMKNHLDRYASENDYYQAKKLMLSNMASGDIAVFNANDSRLRSWAEEFSSKLKVILFGDKVEGYECVWIEKDVILSSVGGVERQLFHSSEMKLAGNHNHENACAAAAVLSASKISDEAIKKGLTSFVGLAHRLEFVREIDGVSYYNDSKATTAESIDCALKAFNGGVHLIAGGRDKGCDFASIRKTVSKHARTVILIGEATERIAADWHGIVEIVRANSLADAVEICKSKASSGETVVLSPGCSSFDMFKSFEHRGEVFREIVNELN